MTQHAYVDIAVMDHVRDALVAGDAVFVLSNDLESLIFANGGGLKLLGLTDLDQALGGNAGLTLLQKRQLAALHGFPHFPGPRMAMLRFTALPGQAVGLTCRSIDFGNSESAILIVAKAVGSDAALAQTARLLGEGLCHAAIVAADGGITAASKGFPHERLAKDELNSMLRDIRDEDDRLVKRAIGVGAKRLPSALARLRDHDPLHLFVIVDGLDEDSGGEPATPRTDNATSRDSVFAPIADAEPVGLEDNGFAARAAARAFDDTEPSEDTASDPQENDTSTADAILPATLRFAWKTDQAGRFSEMSPSFLDALGVDSDTVIGRSFAELAGERGMDPDGTIAALFERRDTWSGRQVVWPLAGRHQGVPVELAALPTFTRERVFAGFRGFGTARFDALSALAQPESKANDAEPADAPRGGANVVTFGKRRSDSDIIAEGTTGQGLTPAEASAFEKIARQLREETDNSEDEPPAPPQLSDERLGDLADAMDRPPYEAFDDSAWEDIAPPQPTSTRMTADAPLLGDDMPDDDDRDDSPVHADAAADVAEPERIRDFAVVDAKAFDDIAAPILIHAGDALHYANPAFLALSGYDSLEDIIAAGGLDALFVDSDDNDDAPGVVLEGRHGERHTVDAHLKSIRWQGGHALLLVLRPINGGNPDGDGDGLSDLAEIDDGNNGFDGADVSKLVADQPEPVTTKPDSDLPSAIIEAREKIEELNSILDTATDGVVIIDADGRIRSLNGSAQALFGYEPLEVEGQPFTMLFAMESHRKVEDYLAGLDGSGVASVLNDGREMIGRERQGRFIPLFMTIGRLAHSSGFCAVLRDLTHWKQTEDALNAAKREAEVASGHKTQFLARISHEIRTPLNAIIGFSDLMLSEKFGPLGSPRYRDYLFDIHKSGNLVLQLVNDLLDIAKIEAGEEVLTFEAVSLEEIAADAVSIIQPEANRQRVLVRSSFSPDSPQVVADARSVKQIALNLLSNAVRYTGSGGQVIVSTFYDLQSGEHALRIRDTGIGMSAVEIEEALKPYRQIRQTGERRGGTGLGLPLTKAMTEANRARFKISSTPGAGTIIEIAFPPSRVLAG